jgi:ribosome production factor 2
MKKPASKIFNRKNATLPFEDPASIEFLSQQNDASMLALGSHSKKRPHNLTFARFFDHQLLDLLELGVNEKTFKNMESFNKTRTATVRYGGKPCFVFQGDQWTTEPAFKTAQSLLLDLFRGEVIDKINLAGLDRVIVCTAVGDVIHFRHYATMLRRSGTKYPRIELGELLLLIGKLLLLLRKISPFVCLFVFVVTPPFGTKYPHIELGEKLLFVEC